MKSNFFKALAVDIHHQLERYKFTFEPRPFMPSKERQFLEMQYLDALTILEFGSGGSTLFAIENDKFIVSVESDKKFFNYLSAHIAKKYKLQNSRVILAKTGITGRYGMPIFFPFSPNVVQKGLSYVLTGYSHFVTRAPDLVFVDGRWRVACCLYSLLSGFTSSKLLLDDFESDRSYMHMINRYFNVDMHGRIACLKPRNEIDAVRLVDDFIECLKNPE